MATSDQGCPHCGGSVSHVTSDPRGRSARCGMSDEAKRLEHKGTDERTGQ